MDFAQIILSPFVWLLTFFYDFFGSYGIALILFAVVVKLILFPFALKGKRSMIQMSAIIWRSRSFMSGRRSTQWAAACGLFSLC